MLEVIKHISWRVFFPIKDYVVLLSLKFWPYFLSKSNAFQAEIAKCITLFQYLKCKILHGGTLLHPRPNTFGMRKYFSGNYVFPSPKSSEDKKKGLHRNSGLNSAGICGDLFVLTGRRVARIWKRRGLFWKSEKCANDLDSNFHWSWISFRWFVRKLRRNVSESSEIQRFFPPKIRWSPKKEKKKGLRQNSEWFRPKSEIQRFFPPKIRWSPKKNWPQKHKKHAILHTSQANGGARAPPPPLATLLLTGHFRLINQR